MAIKRRNFRKIEIIAGFFMILSMVTFFISFLLGFDFSMPEGNFTDDIDFMLDNAGRVQLSGILWLISGLVNLVYGPFYLVYFHRFSKWVHLLNSFLLVTVAFSFYGIGLLHLDIVRFAEANPDYDYNADALNVDMIQRIIMQIKFFYQTGISAYAAFATVISRAKYAHMKLPALGSTVILFAGPIVLVLIWLNQGTVIMTTALALMWVGMLNIGLRLVNWGMKKGQQPPTSNLTT